MAFLDDIQKAKVELENNKERAFAAIRDYFQEQFESPEFEEALKKVIINAMKYNYDHATVAVEYWHSYGNSIRFTVTCCKDWEINTNKEHLFEGIDVDSYSGEIVRMIVTTLSKKLRTLGLQFAVANKTKDNYHSLPKYVYEIEL
jgi:hypothetical protein